MALSAPLHRLKRNAKRHARAHDVPLHAALDHVAAQEGAASWSHLVSRQAETDPLGPVLSHLKPGTLMLLGARPGQGKTLMALSLAARAGQSGRAAWVFTLDYTHADVEDRLTRLGLTAEAIAVDTSDAICAEYVVDQLAGAPAIAVIDFMQILDQRRSDPPLQAQVATLRQCADATGACLVLVSQIDRAFDLSGREMPGWGDLRLPNPLDLGLFDLGCFVHDGRMQVIPSD